VSNFDDITERLGRAADEVPEELSALLLEAADIIRMLRELVTVEDETGPRGLSQRAELRDRNLVSCGGGTVSEHHERCGLTSPG
jgi:hypothetical protein